MPVTRKDFIKSRKHVGYFTRDLGDNGGNDGSQWVELIREDGYGFGAVPVPDLEATVERIDANPPESTGLVLDDIFEGGTPDRLEPPTPPEPVEAPDAEPEVVVKHGRLGRR